MSPRLKLPKRPELPEKVRHYLHEARVRVGDKNWRRLEVFYEFWHLVITGFINNRCPVRATALAYTTLLALLPLLAIVASISTGILKSQGQAPIDKAIDAMVRHITPEVTPEDVAAITSTNEVVLVDSDTEEAIVEGTTNQTAAAQSGTNAPSGEREMLSEEGKRAAAKAIESIDRQQISEFIQNALRNIDSGSLGVTGMAGLIFVAILLFSTIEATFNDIWGVSKGRSWVARIVQYWATVTLGPLIPIFVMSLNVSASLTTVDSVMNEYGLGFLSSFFIERVVPVVLPILILSFGFAFFYQLMPNTKVRWVAAILGGFTAGLLWQLNSFLSFIFAARAVTYNKLYGPLAMVPLFLVGLYFSWLILLFGAQVAYAFQNRVAYLQEKEAQNINFLGLEYLALRIMTLLGQRFDAPQATPPGVIEVAQHLRVSTRLADDILRDMMSGGLVTETTGDENGYTLSRPLEKITCDDILTTLRTVSGKTTLTVDDSAKPVIDEIFSKIMEAERSVSGKRTLRELVDHAGEWQPLAEKKQKQVALPAVGAPA